MHLTKSVTHKYAGKVQKQSREANHPTSVSQKCAFDWTKLAVHLTPEPGWLIPQLLLSRFRSQKQANNLLANIHKHSLCELRVTEPSD